MNENAYENEVEAEILALDSIYGDKLKYNIDKRTVKITIYPATAENMSSQYVCLPVTFLLPKDYPESPPEIIFSSSRGLSDTTLQTLGKMLRELANDRCGECILFDLIDMAKDSLTTNNIPSCLCSICLSGFQDGDEFLKTDCHHYFHSYCLNEYSKYLQKAQDSDEKYLDEKYNETLPCPVCRVMVAVDTEVLKEAKAPLHDAEPEVDLSSIKQHHSKFDKVYERQLKNGCLIDLEYERKKYLLSTMQQVYENRIASSNGLESSKPESSDTLSTSHESELQSHSRSNQHKRNLCFNLERKKDMRSGSNKPNQRRQLHPEHSNCNNKGKQNFGKIGLDRKDTTRSKYTDKCDGCQANTTSKYNKKTTEGSPEQRKIFDTNKKKNQNDGQAVHSARTKNNYYKKCEYRQHAQQNQPLFKSHTVQCNPNRYQYHHKRQFNKHAVAVGVAPTQANSESNTK